MGIKCPKCQYENPDDTIYCGKCAAPLKSAEEISITKTLITPTERLQKGSTIAGRYKIIEELGRGGMGVVYKAQDNRLDRIVALKFLPSELTCDEEAKKRFIQEAKAAAALDHPNICTVYEVDEADGQTFIAMSYIEGQSLKDKLKDGPLDIDEAIDIALQVAEGLKKAHDKGIVHRDIKPANIMINDEGQTKITDFGLAKLSWGADLTRAATVMGTVAYMSPEQAKGEEVDHRTDIWSLGAMFYEMLTGKRPFKKKQEHAVIHAILNEEPEHITSIRKDISKNIERIVNRALEKDANRRYQKIEELIQDLKASPPLTFPKVEKSIVVLPFEDISPGRDNEYFSDGLTEEIISDLSKIHDLLVISRSSAMTYKGTKKKIKDIGRELNVRYVLEGSVRKSGNNLRITAQLIEAKTDAHLWAEKYSGTLDDVFDIQEKVSRSLVDALKLKLSPEEDRLIAERPVKDLVAYEAYLRSKQKITWWTEDAIDSAIALLKKAIEIEGPNELLFATLGIAYTRYWGALPFRQDESELEKAEDYAAKVFEMNPDSSDGHVLKGTVQFFRGKIREAAAHIKKAHHMNPNNSNALFYLGWISGVSGQMDKCRSYYGKLTALDPWAGMNPGWIEYYSGNFEQSIDGYQKEFEMDPKSPYTRWAYACTLAWALRTDEACEILEKIVRDTPDTIFGQFASFLMNALQGRAGEALRTVTPELISAAKVHWQLPWMMAAIYSLIGKTEESLDWLEQAINRGFINYPFLAEKEPFLENIRGEERFKKLMERVKHEWETFEV